MPPKRNAARVPKQTYKEDIDDDTIEEVEAEQESSLPSAKRAKASAYSTQHTEDINNAPPPSSGLGQETQQFTAALEAFQKQQTAPKDTFLAKFVKEAEKKRAEIAELPKKRDRELAQRNSAFIKAFNSQVNAALTKPQITSNDKDNAEPQTKTQNPQTLQDHPLYTASNAWLSIANNTTNTYKSACQLAIEAKPSASLGDRWQEEGDALIGILEMGKRVTQRQMDAMTERKENAVPRAEEELEADAARAVLGMRLDTRQDVVMGGQGQSVSWVESVKCAERGVKRLAGGLPAPPMAMD